jgi:nitroimidazol reductase NimA-like FMN-containing flavoprotein (pyridoxamine 5'-phosphate oxidase superfamily)
MFEEQAETFLQTQTHMVISVVTEAGTPWAVPVKIQNRHQMTFEWDSKVTTVHSQAIKIHPDVAICVFQKSNGDEREMGVCGSGRAEIVTEREDGVARYKVTLQRAWLNGQDHVKRELDIAKVGVHSA